MGELTTVRIVDALGPDLVAAGVDLAALGEGDGGVMVESLNSWANPITAMRILLAPLVFLAIPEDGSGSWWAFLLWFVLCSSDGIDGYIARRRGPTTVGAFLDPLADKVLVLGAMFTLVAHDIFWWVPVAMIAARELTIDARIGSSRAGGA